MGARQPSRIWSKEGIYGESGVFSVRNMAASFDELNEKKQEA